MQSQPDRRANVRLNRVLAVEFTQDCLLGRRFITDISASGFRIASDEPCQPEQQVEFRLLLNKGQQVQGLARVVWLEELHSPGLYELGFEFVELESPEQLQALLDFLEEHRITGSAREPAILGLREQMEVREIASQDIDRLAVLARICSYFNGSFTLQEVMQKVLQVLTEITGAERSFFLLDRGFAKLDMPAFHGLDGHDDRRYSEVVVRKVREGGRPLLSLDVSKDNRLSESASLRLMGTRSVLCVPIVGEGRQHGLLYLDNSIRAGAFTQSELELANILAGMAAAALERAEYLDQLVQSEKMAALGTMMAGVMHELTNPLTSLLTIGEVLRQQGEEMAEPMMEEVLRCRNLVDLLLETSRKEPPMLQPVDVTKVVREVVELVDHQFEGEGVLLQADLPPSIWVEGNADRLRQIFLNLLSNALHAVQGDPVARVEIDLGRSRGSVFVTVSDNGPGIPPQAFTRIFDPFFTTKESHEGTGLGLSVTRRLVAEHNGRVYAEAPPEGGARFVVVLPALSAGADVAAEAR